MAQEQVPMALERVSVPAVFFLGYGYNCNHVTAEVDKDI